MHGLWCKCLFAPVFAVCRLRCQQVSAQLQSLAAEVDRASKAPGLKQGFALLKRCIKMTADLQTGLAQQQRYGDDSRHWVKLRQ
jgi:hypothetical protein